jgi:DNA-binding PadR family transcriptional regulator
MRRDLALRDEGYDMVTRPTGRHGRDRRGDPGLGDEGHPSWLHEILSQRRAGFQAMRRGNVRFAILAVLQESPMHGYQVIQELEARTAGRWRPSAGSVYPTLQQLEDEGLLRSEVIEGRRTYSLTDAGRKAAADTPLRRHPWFDRNAGREAIDLRRQAMQLIGAAVQVKRMGSPEANRRARDILDDSRRQLYRLLADDVGEPEGSRSREEGAP